jgi:hypothetical protein
VGAAGIEPVTSSVSGKIGRVCDLELRRSLPGLSGFRLHHLRFILIFNRSHVDRMWTERGRLVTSKRGEKTTRPPLQMRPHPCSVGIIFIEACQVLNVPKQPSRRFGRSCPACHPLRPLSRSRWSVIRRHSIADAASPRSRTVDNAWASFGAKRCLGNDLDDGNTDQHVGA